jgi:hypothetical protein
LDPIDSVCRKLLSSYAAPFQMPSALRVAVTSTIQAVRLAAMVMLEETDTTELA